MSKRADKFIRWLCQQTQYADLVLDMGPNIKTLEELRDDMRRYRACKEARAMLDRAVKQFGERP